MTDFSGGRGIHSLDDLVFLVGPVGEEMIY